MGTTYMTLTRPMDVRQVQRIKDIAAGCRVIIMEEAQVQYTVDQVRRKIHNIILSTGRIRTRRLFRRRDNSIQINTRIWHIGSSINSRGANNTSNSTKVNHKHNSRNHGASRYQESHQC